MKKEKPTKNWFTILALIFLGLGIVFMILGFTVRSEDWVFSGLLYVCCAMFIKIPFMFRPYGSAGMGCSNVMSYKA